MTIMFLSSLEVSEISVHYGLKQIQIEDTKYKSVWCSRVFGYTALWLNTSAIFVLVSTHSRIEGAVTVEFNLHYNTYHHHSWVCI